jgi:hypothetical protein
MDMDIIRRPSQLPTGMSRGEVQRLAAARTDGLIAAERIFAAAYATDQALQHVGRLSELEVRLMERAQFGDGRYRDLIDTFTGVARAEIAYLAIRCGR